MRYASVFVLLALWAAPFRVWGQDIAPAPGDRKCAVQPDGHWKPQERFVWSHVCVGEEADFNKVPEYGGDLDPKNSKGLPDSRVLSSTFLETILLQDNYRNALTRRGIRIVGARFTEVIDLENADLHHDLWLDKSLLERGANFVGARTTRRITISGSYVTGQLNMTEIHVDEDLTLHNGSEFVEVNLESAQIGGKLEFDHGSKVTGALKMEGIQIAGHLVMNSKAEFAAVDLTAAHVQGVTSLWGSKFTGALGMHGLKVDGMVEANDSEFGEVDLEFAHIGGKLNLRDSKVTGPLNMQGTQIAGHLVMIKGKYTSVDLTAAHIGGIFSLWESRFTGALGMHGLEVGGMVEANDSKFNEIELQFAHIGWKLNLGGSKVTGSLNMQGTQIAGHLVMIKGEYTSVDLTAAHIGGMLSLWGSKVTRSLFMFGLQVDGMVHANDSELDEVNFEFAHIGGEFSIEGSKVTGSLNMQGTQIGQMAMKGATFGKIVIADSITVGGSVLAKNAKFSKALSLVSAHIGGSLDLRDSVVHRIDLTGALVTNDLRLGGKESGQLEWRCAAEAGTGAQPAARWTLGDTGWGSARCGEHAHDLLPKLILRNTQVGALQDTADVWPPDLDLEGFKYDRLGGLGGELAADIRERLPEQWRDWLARDRTFSTQPYAQLASVLQAAGHRDTAETIHYYSRIRDRNEEKHWGRWIWLTLIGDIAGYGIGLYTFYVLYWVAFLTLLGALILKWYAPNARRHGVVWCLGASLQQLLPVVVLSQEFKDFFDNREPIKPGDTRNLTGWQAAFFSMHALAGWVLGFFLLAAMSGLTPKD